MLLAMLLSGPILLATPDDRPTIGAICKNPEVVYAGDTWAKPGIKPLGDAPPAKHILAVVRTVDGCVKPVVVKAEVGKR